MEARLQTLVVARGALRPPTADRPGVGLLVSLLAHALLIAGLSLGVQWHTQDPEGVEAELWASTPQIAAPAAAEPPPAQAPEPTPPRPRPVPPAPPPPDLAAQQQREAEIAIEQAKKEKARKDAEDQRARDKRQQQLERERQQKDEQAKKAKAEQQAQAAREEAQRQAAEQKTRDKAKADQAQKDKADADKREAQRQENIRRMNAQLGGTGSADSSGTAAQSAGPSANYAGRIKAYIKPNIVLTDTIPGNPTAEVEVRVAPDGSIISRRLSKPSGSTAWDEAVLRAIDRTAKLPRDTDGRVPASMLISFKPSE